jgi:hypothetical protein
MPLPKSKFHLGLAIVIMAALNLFTMLQDVESTAQAENAIAGGVAADTEGERNRRLAAQLHGPEQQQRQQQQHGKQQQQQQQQRGGGEGGGGGGGGGGSGRSRRLVMAAAASSDPWVKCIWTECQSRQQEYGCRDGWFRTSDGGDAAGRSCKLQQARPGIIRHQRWGHSFKCCRTPSQSEQAAASTPPPQAPGGGGAAAPLVCAVPHTWGLEGKAHKAMKRKCCAACLASPASCPTPYPYCYVCCFVVNGGWSKWGMCTKRCGHGVQFRRCNHPTPRNGGKPCTGAAVRACNTASCMGVHFSAPLRYRGACRDDPGLGAKCALLRQAATRGDYAHRKRVLAAFCTAGRREYVRCAATCGRCTATPPKKAAPVMVGWGATVAPGHRRQACADEDHLRHGRGKCKLLADALAVQVRSY